MAEILNLSLLILNLSSCKNSILKEHFDFNMFLVALCITHLSHPVQKASFATHTLFCLFVKLTCWPSFDCCPMKQESATFPFPCFSDTQLIPFCFPHPEVRNVCIVDFFSRRNISSCYLGGCCKPQKLFPLFVNVSSMKWSSSLQSGN